jgi:hypothetical protein
VERIRLLSYSALEMPIGKGCLYAFAVKVGPVAGSFYARLTEDGRFCIPVEMPPERAELGKWYSPELAQLLSESKRDPSNLIRLLSEAALAAVAHRDRRVSRPMPFAHCVDPEATSRTMPGSPARRRTAKSGKGKRWSSAGSVRNRGG